MATENKGVEINVTFNGPNDMRTGKSLGGYELGSPTEVECPRCRQIIDPAVCGCGDYIEGHGDPMETGHDPVPMGCDCFRSGLSLYDQCLAAYRKLHVDIDETVSMATMCRELAEERDALEERFHGAIWKDDCCSCHLSPPCSYCVDGPGSDLDGDLRERLELLEGLLEKVESVSGENSPESSEPLKDPIDGTALTPPGMFLHRIHDEFVYWVDPKSGDLLAEEHFHSGQWTGKVAGYYAIPPEMCREPTTTEKIREERENMQKVSHRTCAETGESAVASAKGVGISAPKAAQPVYTDTGEDFELTDAEIRAWRLKNG